KRPNGQNIVGAERTGAWLRLGGPWRRLADALFAVSEAVGQVAAADADTGKRLEAISALREALPTAEADGSARPHGLAGTLTIEVASSFSLDLTGDGPDAKLVPI